MANNIPMDSSGNPKVFKITDTTTKEAAGTLAVLWICAQSNPSSSGYYPYKRTEES